MNIEVVKSQLKDLKLSTAAREIEEVLVRHKGAADTAWVSQLLEREIDARRERALQKRIERASVGLGRRVWPSFLYNPFHPVPLPVAHSGSALLAQFWPPGPN